MSDIHDELDEALSDEEEGGASSSEQASDVEHETTIDDTVRLRSLDGNAIATVIPRPEIRIQRGEDHHVEAYVESDHQDYSSTSSHTKMGEYVRLPFPGTGDELFAEVEGLTYENRADFGVAYDRGPGGVDEEAHKDDNFDQYLILRPIATLEADETAEKDVGRRPVDTLPPAEMRVFECKNEDLLRAGIGIPHEGPFLGYLKSGGQKRPIDDPLTYLLDNPSAEDEDPALFRHMLVAGSTGVGKTQFTKNFYRQLMATEPYEVTPHETTDTSKDLLKKKLGMVLIDPESEYAGLANDNPSLPAEAKQRYQNEGIAVGGLNEADASNDVQLKAFVPKIKNSSNPSLPSNVPTREFGIPFRLCKNSPSLPVTFSPQKPTQNAIRGIIRRFFNEEGGTYQDFCTYLQDNEDRFEGIYGDQVFSAVRTRLFDQHVLDRVFDHTDAMIDSITNEMFRSGQISVIPTSHLSGRADKLVVMSILSLIVENKLTDNNVDTRIKDTPLYLGIDEAHNYLEHTETAQSQYIVNRFREVAKQGRKYNFGVGMVTQTPLDIDEEIRQQANTKTYLSLDPDVIEKLNIPGGFGDELQNFGKGDALIKAPDVRPVQIEGLRYPVVEH